MHSSLGVVWNRKLFYLLRRSFSPTLSRLGLRKTGQYKTTPTSTSTTDAAHKIPTISPTLSAEDGAAGGEDGVQLLQLLSHWLPEPVTHSQSWSSLWT